MMRNDAYIQEPAKRSKLIRPGRAFSIPVAIIGAVFEIKGRAISTHKEGDLCEQRFECRLTAKYDAGCNYHNCVNCGTWLSGEIAKELGGKIRWH